MTSRSNSSLACMGRYTSGAAPGSTPKKPDGVTPITVNATLLTRIGWPAASAAPPKRRSL